jgi:N-acetylneuraminate synthase
MDKQSSKILKIHNRKIGKGQPCFLIAEAGVNHNGDLEMAKELINVAVTAGADAVKFQTFKTENIVLSDVGKASHQKRTTRVDETQADMLRKLEMDRAFHVELIHYCRDKGVLFLSTPYDEDSLALLLDLNVPAIKIASTDTTNLLFLEKVARSGKPVIFSTGMSSLEEVENAFHCLKDNGCEDIAILKCTANYPTAITDVNLSGMTTLMNRFDAIIGFSDHTEAIGASPYAVAMGADIVEKHFTLDKTLDGPDHVASLSPQELVMWVKEVRRVEQMLGREEIKPTENESETKQILQKCLVSKVNIEKGEKLSRDHLVAKRTGGRGVSAFKLYSILGSKVNKDIMKDQPVEWSDVSQDNTRVGSQA